MFMKTSGLDVHKDTIFCAIYNGKSYSEVTEFSTTTNSIRALGEYLKKEGVNRVAMESTSTYWVPVWDVLYEMEFELMLVNPFLIKQMPGKKSDAKDAQWIAKLLYKNMLSGSYVPPPIIQALRTYSRKYTKLQQKRTQLLTEMDRKMVMCGIRISSCMSNLGTKSTINIVEALIQGETNPDNLVKLVYGNTANKKSGKLKECLTGNLKEHQRFDLELIKACTERREVTNDMIERHIEACLQKMQEICEEHFKEELELLRTMPGVSVISAMIIIAETGGDMSVFENSGKLAGWTGLRPRNDESAGKYKSTATTKGNKYLRTIMVQVAWAAVRTKGCFFMEKFTKLAIRKSRKKALVAISRKMLVITWHILSEKKPYNPSIVHIYDPIKVEAKINYHNREIEKAKKLIS